MKDRLRNVLRTLGSVVIGYSGGVDSAYLLDVATEVLGRERALGIFVASEFTTKEDEDHALALAEGRNLRVLVLRESLNQGEVAENGENRCYHCKKRIFSRIVEVAEKEGFSFVADGTNVDDLADVRPGLLALKELHVVSPLLEAGYHKEDVRQFSKERGLDTWNLPSAACLASRIPMGNRITSEELSKVKKAEKVLKDAGLQGIRVRSHGDIARIEMSCEDFPFFLGRERKKVVAAIKAFGYRYVTLDLEGYVPGGRRE